MGKANLLLVLLVGTSCLAFALGGEGAARPLPLVFSSKPRNARTLLNTFPFNARQQGQNAHHNDQGHHGHHEGHHGSHQQGHQLGYQQGLQQGYQQGFQQGHNQGHSPGHNQGHHQGHNQGHHQGHHDNLPIVRQGQGELQLAADNSVDVGAVASAGERCVQKVMMQEELVYDDVIECHHSYDERCHKTFVTQFKPSQEEECDEKYKKECFIDYKKITVTENVEICDEPLVRNCDKPGPTVCETVYESQCETTYHEHEVEEDVPNCRIMQVRKCRDVTQGYSTVEQCDLWPKQVCDLETKVVVKSTPDTQCQKVPRQVCGPGPCPMEPGPKQCRTEQKNVIQDKPEENCQLTPFNECRFITKLVPFLKETEECMDIPKEVCTRVKANPRKVKKPIIKKWCYTPSSESGLSGNPEPITENTGNPEVSTEDPDSTEASTEETGNTEASTDETGNTEPTTDESGNTEPTDNPVSDA